MASLLIQTLVLFLANLIILVASSSYNHHNHQKFHQCLQKSNSGPDGIIFTPNNASYLEFLRAQNRWPLATSPERPLLIITPIHESQIQAAIYCSRKTGLPIRVRSGGHDYEGLSYTSENPFAVVDMRNFDSINIDTGRKTAWVDVGVTLGQLYYALSRKSKTLAFTAGTCPTVGVGGHLSGGGYGMMSRKHSLAADLIIDAKLINADGKILNRRSMGEDLFWAIRGGGGTSFGIVVAYKVKLVVVPETVTVFNVTRTTEQNATQLVHKWQYIADKVDDRLLLRLFLASIWSPTSTTNRTISVSFTSLFIGRVHELLPIMQEKFPELGLSEQDCTEMSWIDSAMYFAELTDQPLERLLNRTHSSGNFYKGKSDYVKDPIPISGLEGIWGFLHQQTMAAQLQFSPYGGAINSYSESETPFPHRSGNIFMIHYLIEWSRLKDSASSLDWMKRLYRYTARYVSKSPRAAYFNYRDLDIGVNNEGNTSYAQASVWGRKYFKSNFRRLARVKTDVDPTNFFRNEQSVPPLTKSW